MEVLLEKGADPNLDTGEFCAFTYAANLGCVDQLNILLRYHKPILDQLDSEGRSLLTHAVMSGNIECVRAVLRNMRSQRFYFRLIGIAENSS
jgi:ankyrin repeat protein